MSLKTSYRIVVKAIFQWNDNLDSRLAAALAYYALFSFAPLLLLAITVVGTIYDQEQVRQNLYEQLQKTMGDDGAHAAKFLVDNAGAPRDSWGLVGGLAVLLFGALGMFLHARTSLVTIWKLEPLSRSTYLGVVFDYLLAMAMVPIVGALLLATLISSAAVEFVGQHAPGGVVPWRLIERAGSILLLAALFAAVYRILSGNRLSWGYTLYGAVIASLLFTVGKILMGYYIYYFSPSSAYGATGSVMVFLLWVYYSANILFFGAELIQARRTRFEWLPLD